MLERVGWLLLFLSIGSVKAEEGLKERLMAQAHSVRARDYAFTRTTRAEQLGGKITKTMVEKFDPAKEPASRWTLVSVDGRAPDNNELRTYQKADADRRALSYERVALYLSGASDAQTDARGRTVFRFSSLPKGTVVMGEADLSPNVEGYAAIKTEGSTPFVEEVHTTVKQPLRLKLVAKIEDWQTTTRFRLFSDGKPVPAEQILEMTASILGHQSRVRSVTTYSDFRKAQQ